MARRVPHLDSLVLFLNRWNCHLPTRTGETPIALQEWLEREQDTLEALAGASLTDAGLADRLEESNPRKVPIER